MLDAWIIKRVDLPLTAVARMLKTNGIQPDQLTLAGFGLGITAFLSIWMNYYIPGLVFILLNRIMDGLDGALARLTGPTDAGGFLDICLDFIFYSAVAAGFALASPEANALAAALLIFGFVGTGTSFLAFAALARKHHLTSPAYPHKSIYYMGGLTEGTETLVFFILICLFPDWFPFFAAVFFILCLITTATRIFTGYRTLKAVAKH
ncbi:MAG: CDP-alcohol phosphatidyltransferase family protein [Desulfobacula sp.]|nr:CDP-alcohol phosphatidyltransferase family protein [Desulfobacula sp.]